MGRMRVNAAIQRFLVPRCRNYYCEVMSLTIPYKILFYCPAKTVVFALLKIEIWKALLKLWQKFRSESVWFKIFSAMFRFKKNGPKKFKSQNPVGNPPPPLLPSSFPSPNQFVNIIIGNYLLQKAFLASRSFFRAVATAGFSILGSKKLLCIHVFDVSIQDIVSLSC